MNIVQFSVNRPPSPPPMIPLPSFNPCRSFSTTAIVLCIPLSPLRGSARSLSQTFLLIIPPSSPPPCAWPCFVTFASSFLKFVFSLISHPTRLFLSSFSYLTPTSVPGQTICGNLDSLPDRSPLGKTQTTFIYLKSAFWGDLGRNPPLTPVRSRSETGPF